MKPAILIPTILLIYIISSPALFSQTPAEMAPETDPAALEIIAKAEAKLYSPLREGLKSLKFIQQFGLDRAKRMYWFKAPDKKKSVFGVPPEEQDDRPGIKRAIYVESRVKDIVTSKNLGWVLGTPISCFKPYGTFIIVHQDQKGAQIRFTAVADDILNLVWTHIDFYFDEEFRLTKIHERFSSEGQLEEHRIELKPYKEGAELLVFDTINTIAGTAKSQHVMLSKFHYSEVDSYCFMSHIDRELKQEKKKIKDKYFKYQVNPAIDDSEFEKKE